MSPEGHLVTKWSKPFILHLNLIWNRQVFRGVSVSGILGRRKPPQPRGWVRTVRLKTQSRQSEALASCSNAQSVPPWAPRGPCTATREARRLIRGFVPRRAALITITLCHCISFLIIKFGKHNCWLSSFKVSSLNFKFSICCFRLFDFQFRSSISILNFNSDFQSRFQFTLSISISNINF